jgi:hypothetical protein
MIHDYEKSQTGVADSHPIEALLAAGTLVPGQKQCNV